MYHQKIRILILDDDPEGVGLVRDLLAEVTRTAPVILCASNYEEGLVQIRGGGVDVCLVDYLLGERTGIDFLEDPDVRRSGIPVILMAGPGMTALDRIAIKAGAVDYLPKDELTGRGLERAIRYAVERRRREQAESQFHTLLGGVQEIVTILNADGSYRYVSPSLVRVLGFPSDARAGVEALLEVHPDDRPELERALQLVLEDPAGRRDIQYRARHADGSWRVLDAVAENHLGDPHVRGVVVSSRDVTDRVRREEQVRFQASLLDAVGQAVVATDLSGRVTFWNPVAEQHFGWSRADALGRNVVELGLAAHERVEDIFENTRLAGTWAGEFKVGRQDGTYVLMLVSTSLILNAAGGEVGLISVFSDITALKETESALVERVKELRALSRASEILNDSDRPIEERLGEAVEIIPSGWQNPENTKVRLTWDDRTIETQGFRETEWMQEVALKGSNIDARLEVALVGDLEEGVYDPFLPEEYDLLENLGRILCDAIDRASLQRLVTQAFASIQEAILVLDARDGETGIRYANPAAEEMFGYAADELQGGRSDRLFVDRASFERSVDEAVAMLEQEKVFTASIPMRRKDGSTFEAEQTVTLLNRDLGLDGGVVSVVRDVSQRKAAERGLRESEERFRQIAEHIGDVFWISTPGEVVKEYVSPAYAKIWGRSLADLHEHPESWLESVVPEDLERVKKAISVQGRGAYEQQYRILRPDGEERTILDRTFPVRNAVGEVERVIGVAKDVTEARRLEDRFGLLSQEISDVIYVTSADGTVLMSSPSVRSGMGFTRTEFEGRNAEDVVHPDDRKEFSSKLREVSSEPGKTVRAEYRIVTKEGDTRYVESVARNLLGDPAIRGILFTSRDITERRELEHRVRQMQKMESIGQLAGGIAHDFNNILTVIGTQTDLLLMDIPAGAAADELAIIRVAAERAASLTGQLLAFSRDQILQPRVVDLSAVVEGTGKLLRRIIGENIHITYSLGDGLPAVRVDPNQLEQVIINLALNARDAMPVGGMLTLSVYVEEVDAVTASDLPGLSPGTHVVLAVSDTGTGMTDEVMQHAFEPFFTTKSKGKGTGLGLAMVYGTVKQSGGSIHMESEPGVGTTFYLRFPAMKGEVAVERMLAEAQQRSADDPPVTGRVLVIEDNAAVRRAVLKVLERAGFTVVAVEDAESGMALLESDRSIDVVLSDLMLPGMSGYDLVDRLRGAFPELPLIVMSGFTEGSFGHREGLPTDVAFVPKPFTTESIINTVRNALGAT